MLELLHKVLFAFISGFSEFIFASTTAHQLLYQTVTGYRPVDSLLMLGIHLGCLAALLKTCHHRIKHLRNEKRLDRPGKRRRVRQPDVASLLDIRILNTAVVPLLLGFVLYPKVASWGDSPLRVALVLVLNGVVLFLPRLLQSGNKNGRSFSGLDSFLMGAGGTLGVIPGFSAMGCMFSVGAARGAQKSYALELSILLSIPAICAMLCFDVYGCAIADTGVTGFQFLGALVASLASFAGACMAIALIRVICSRSTTTSFAYYSWGLAMFLLLIYLFVA